MTRTYPLEAAHSATLKEAVALVGGKAANLGVMIRELGLPVPPGFVITTATCREFLADGWPAGLDAELRQRMSEVDAKVGRKFGDPSDPLVVSVRSGAPVSMPGMMDSILDLGLNEATTIGLGRASGSEEFARACRERFEAMYRSIVGGEDVPEDPWEQLRHAIEAVFASWNSDRAVAYRRKEHIPDDLGTAVTVQVMVFGNRGSTSATGVVFTRNPATGEPGLYGDVLFKAQGEDVVAGAQKTDPIAALQERMPDIAAELREYADRLERHYADMCDIEFTIEERRLWLLQVRVGKRSPQAALRIALDLAEDSTFPLDRRQALDRVMAILAHPPTTSTLRRAARPLATGLAASPGIASGPIALTPDAAIEAAEQGSAAVLVRAETSPEDVQGMARAAGILTARGGLASHAAVVARGWGIPAVVGATTVEVGASEATIGGRAFRRGDKVTIDGSTGEIFEGALEGSATVIPQADTLLAWARELGIAVGSEEVSALPATPVSATTPPTPATPTGSVTHDACLRVIAIKGFAPLKGLADAVLAAPDDVRPVADDLVASNLAANKAGSYGLSEAGRTRVAQLLEDERQRWGLEAASAAIDAFIQLDHRMKEIVTAWQLRDPQAQVLNDHSDPEYDGAVIDRLAALHADAMNWLKASTSGCPRLASYGPRLERAMERARAGDHRYIASPRVDSYHGVWFELHEDLIQLAGRTREEEAAAGRA